MTKAVAKTGETQLAAPAQRVAPKVEASDILIPRIFLQQPMSDLVSESKAKPGDLVRSTTKTVIATNGKPLEILPLTFFKTWEIRNRRMDEQRFGFVRIEPYSVDNCNLPNEWQEENMVWRRYITLNVYCLLVDDIKKDEEAFAKAMESGDIDTDDSLLPVLISFKSTSYPAGKVLTSYFGKLDDFSERTGNVFPYYYNTFKLGSEFVKKDENKYYVYTVTKDRKCSENESASCLRWSNLVATSASKIKVDDVEDQEAPQQAKTAEVVHENVSAAEREF